jgi:K+-sensing histidine kinase KdpD
MGEQLEYEELLEYTRQLEQKVARLEETLKQFQSDGTRVQTRFLSNISHEIRTPMNAIIGFSHLLGDDDVNGDQKESYINHITRNSNSLLNIMDNLIDLTLIETGNMQLKEDEVEIYKLLRELYDTYNLDQYRANRERVALLLNVREAFKDAKIITDKQRLSRALSCLIENALAQTKKGVIEFGASFADKNTMIFTIKDSSNMLLKDEIRTIFETTEKDEGLYNTSDTIGLGYKLASGLVKAMQGEIRVSESSFKGITIEFSIPVRMVTPKHYRPGEEKRRMEVERSHEE